MTQVYILSGSGLKPLTSGVDVAMGAVYENMSAEMGKVLHYNSINILGAMSFVGTVKRLTR